jgi:hypothetical protein
MICLYTTITPIIFTPILTFLFYQHLNTTTGTHSKIPIYNLHHLSKTHLAFVFKSPQQQTVNRQMCLLYRSQATWSHEPNSRHLCHGQCDLVTSQTGYVCLTFCCSHISLSLNYLDANSCSLYQTDLTHTTHDGTIYSDANAITTRQTDTGHLPAAKHPSEQTDEGTSEYDGDTTTDPL